MSMETMFVRRGEVRKRLGVSEPTLRKLIEAGALRPRHLLKDKRGRPKGRALFAVVDVMRLAEEG